MRGNWIGWLAEPSAIVATRPSLWGRARKRQGLGEAEPVTVTADDLAYVESVLRRESSEQAAILSRRQRAAGLSTG